jgi:hypothetical protein
MPMTLKAQKKLSEFADESEGFAIFGIMLNPGTGEMATYSSHGVEPGAVLGFLQRAVEQMVGAAASGELEYIGGNDGMAQGSTTQAQGGKIGLVH